MVVPCRHHRDRAAEAVELDARIELLVARSQRRNIGAAGCARIAINIVADQQERLRFLGGDDVPEFHLAIFVDAAAESEARYYRVGGERGIGWSLGEFGRERCVICTQGFLSALRRGGGCGRLLSSCATGEQERSQRHSEGGEKVFHTPSIPVAVSRVKR